MASVRVEVGERRQITDGALTTLQWTRLPGVPPTVLERPRPDAPERLALAYFWQARRLTFLLVRPQIQGDRLIYRPLIGPALLVFQVAERRFGPDGLGLQFDIVGGLAASPGAGGSLRLALEPDGLRLVGRIELRDYRPPLPEAWPIRTVYTAFQAHVHLLHARLYFRWLARHWAELIGGRTGSRLQVPRG